MAKDVTLLIKLNDQASGKIGKITNSTKRLERAANGAQNSIRRTNKGIRETGRAADRASKGVNKLGKAIRGLAAGFGAFQAGKFVIFKTAELERQTKSLEVLTGSLGNARSIIKELQEFGAVTPFTSSELIETAKRLKAFGFQTEEVVDVTKRLADVAGATGADLGGIATAFGQIQAKGRLQGEELLQLQERGVSLQDELQKMYGLTADEFRKALEGGRISADAVNLALQNITDTGGKYANGAIAQSETLAGKFSTLVDGIENIARAIGESISPALKGIIGEAITAVNFITRAINNAALKNKLGLSSDSVVRLQRQADKEAEELVNLRDPRGRLSGFQRSGLFNQLRQERFRDLLKQTGFKTGQLQAEISAPGGKTTTQTPALLAARGGGKKGRTPEEIAAEKLLKLKQQMAISAENEKAASQDVIRGRQQELQTLTLTAQKGSEFAEFTQRVRDLVLQGVPFSEAFELEDGIRKQQQIIAGQQEINSLYARIGQTIETAIVDSLLQAKSASEALSNVLNTVANELMRFALGSFGGTDKGSGSGIFGAVADIFRANGGPVTGGRSYIVGERGPEVFTPGVSGSITPNHALGGANVTVNVDASGSSVEGNADQASQLGKAIGVAVQQELIKQKRPGGLLAS